MAEIVITLVVSPILQEALSRATKIAGRRFREATRDLENDVAKLKDSLTMIQTVLEVAEEMQGGDVAIASWLQKVECLAYDVVDLLDECAYGVHQRELATQSKVFFNQVCDFVFPSKSIPDKIKKIKECSDSIKEKTDFIRLLIDLKKNQNVATYIETMPNPDDNSKVLGRDRDVSEIVGLLRADSSSKDRLSVLSIVGMPGVGKTALARSICQEVQEKNLYDQVVWMCLSKEFNVKKILMGMLEILVRNAGQKKDINAIVSWLRRELEGKKVLLILDDVWNEDACKWEDFFKTILIILSTTGNSIVVTTSNKRVVASASVMDTIHMKVHELHKLSDGECWSIMEEILESPNKTLIPMNLLVIGKDIAKQCGGLPLVAAEIGKALRQRISAEAWLAVKGDTALDSQHRLKILDKLKKCFDHLPAPLKKCFSYCSIFPKDFKIMRDDLIQLWMARGFLHQSGNSKSDKEEDVGKKYLSDLVSNYLLEDVEVDDCGHIKACKMHNEVHNLALFISKHETCIWPGTGGAIEERSRIRHMRVRSDKNLQDIPEDVAQRLRSLFLEVDVFRTRALNPGSLQSLKVAVVDGKKLVVDGKKLQEPLDEVKCYMKYLDISGSEIQELPESITQLYNLQTLRFVDCKSLTELPRGIENLVSLRHIYFDDERHMPRSIRKLTSLQTLPLFVVGTRKGQRIKELKYLSQLRGKLKICNLEQVSESEEAIEARIEEKVDLIKLQFVWRYGAISNNDEAVLQGLQPHSNLKSLTIENYKGRNFPLWMVKGASCSADSFRLNSLVKLKLICCYQWVDISCLGLLPKLTVLNIRAMSEVKRIVSQFYRHRGSNVASSSQVGGQSTILFPALRKLELTNMKGLEEWTEAQGMVVFPRLEELLIQDCPELKRWWASSSQGAVQSILPFPDLRKLTLSNMTRLEEWTEAQGMVPFCHLEELHIEDCPELKTWLVKGSRGESVTLFPVLRKLTLINNPKLEEWTEAEVRVMFTYLEELHIAECLELRTRRGSSNQVEGESITTFPALRKLTLSEMTKLEGWTAEAMFVFPSLEELHIRNCPELETWRASSSQGRGDSSTPFPALRKLTLSHMTKLKEWRDPQGKSVFGCLQELQIQDCPELKTWNIDGSASPNLYMLEIQSCPNLQAIPTGLLGNLKSLDIDKCPNLWKYAEEHTRERHTIRHIPRIRINGQAVRPQES